MRVILILNNNGDFNTKTDPGFHTGGGFGDDKDPYEWKIGTKEKENLNWLLE